MGYASLIEDIIKRFDADSNEMASFEVGKAPSSEAVAERRRLDRERHATDIAIREFQKNQRQTEKNQAAIASLKSQIARANTELRHLKSSTSLAVSSNKDLNRDLAKYRAKYAQRVERLESTYAQPIPTSLALLVTKIEDLKETDLESLDKEGRERFAKMMAYASSQRRLEAQAIEIESLTIALAKIRREAQSLEDFLQNIGRENRSLHAQSRSFQGWDAMNEWLQSNPRFPPKEHPNAQSKSPFNPAFPGGARPATLKSPKRP